MKHLLEEWGNVQSLIKKNALMLCLDYDGTLTSIEARPSLARINLKEKKVLEDLTFLTGDVQVMVISGRSLEDLKKMVEIKGVYYVGNHGFELEGPSTHHVHLGALQTKELMEEIFKKLWATFRNSPGIFVENKIFTLSIHYRELAEEKVAPTERIFSEILQPYVNDSRVILTEGKKVWEIRPAIEWNKGKVLLWLWGQISTRFSSTLLPIYIGDDQTDEDAFKALRQIGIGIKVTQDSEAFSNAGYYLRSPAEVFEFLESLANLKKKKERKHVRI